MIRVSIGGQRSRAKCWRSGVALLCILSSGPLRAENGATELFWGDTHVHSSYSLDANLFNNFTLGPDAAYRFAKGEAVVTGRGAQARLDRPLDFLVVSDHAEYMGVFKMIREGHPAVAASGTAKKVSAFIRTHPVFGPEDIGALGAMLDGDPLMEDEEIQRLVWDEIIDMAERANEPGKFTALVGYEWGSTPDGNNLHRNVIFRDGPERTKRVLPFSAVHSDQPEKLWAFLERYEVETGGQAFAIPHNSNLSNGLMFSVEDSSGRPIDRAHARARARFEPLVEVTQIKGDSEAHPFLSPDDEFADHDTWDKTNIFGLKKTEESMLAGSYARSALKNGLVIQSKIGLNPFAFGLIGSTDAHTSLATAEEGSYWGKTANMPLGEDRSTGLFIRSADPTGVSTLNWEQAAAGYAGVWASENSRAAIFDALRRREVYATTGPRITVRFFAGWGFEPADASARDLAATGYAKGVPMGGELLAGVGSEDAPRFLVAASKDPESGGLQRIQIVKGWLDPEGEARERVFDVRVAEDLEVGEAEMTAVFTDPDFDRDALAFYYARVLEVPTLRWNALDAARFGTPVGEARLSHQERAYTSPIWLTPEALRSGKAATAGRETNGRGTPETASR